MIAWACVFCAPGASAEEAMVEATPTAAPSSSPPAPTPMSASEYAERLASLTTEGQRCKDKGDHDCVIDRYASAYHLLDHEDRTGRLGIRYVDLMVGSCDVLAKQADAAQYRSRFEVFESIIDLQISEIDSRHVIEPTRKRGKKARKHRQREERIQEQRIRLEESKQRLEELLHRLAAEESEETSPPPTIVVTPGPEVPGVTKPLPTTEVDPEPDPTHLEQPKQGELEDDSRRVNTRRLVLGTVGIAGGSLATLSGISLMINGAAWNSCNRNGDDTTSTECSGLVGASRGIFPIAGEKPDEHDVSPENARKNSVFYWVSGSLVTAVGITAVTLGAIAVKRARDENREQERERKRDRARARRESIALAPSWSPFSPRQGGLSITGRF